MKIQIKKIWHLVLKVKLILVSRIKINNHCLIKVYEEPNIKLLVIQQRGNIVSGKRQEFVDQFLTFFKNEQLKEIIVLTAFNAVERNDVQLTG